MSPHPCSLGTQVPVSPTSLCVSCTHTFGLGDPPTAVTVWGQALIDPPSMPPQGLVGPGVPPSMQVGVTTPSVPTSLCVHMHPHFALGGPPHCCHLVWGQVLINDPPECFVPVSPPSMQVGDTTPSVPTSLCVHMPPHFSFWGTPPCVTLFGDSGVMPSPPNGWLPPVPPQGGGRSLHSHHGTPTLSPNPKCPSVVTPGGGHKGKGGPCPCSPQPCALPHLPCCALTELLPPHGTPKYSGGVLGGPGGAPDTPKYSGGVLGPPDTPMHVGELLAPPDVLGGSQGVPSIFRHVLGGSWHLHACWGAPGSFRYSGSSQHFQACLGGSRHLQMFFGGVLGSPAPPRSQVGGPHCPSTFCAGIRGL